MKDAPQNTYYQKGLSLKVPYFVTEVIFGQRFINLAECIQLNSMECKSTGGYFWYYG